MAGVDPWAMVREAEQLAADLDRIVPDATERVQQLWSPPRWAGFDRVLITGSGDSLHAAAATWSAVQRLGGVSCRCVSALPFVAHDDGGLRLGDPSRTLVVVISASGRTPSAVAAAAAARNAGATTLAITGAADGALRDAADRNLVVALPDRERSPGVRTWQASVVGVLLVAIALGESRSKSGLAASLRAELAAAAAAIEATRQAVTERIDGLMPDLAGVPTLVLLGTGPSRGVAMYGAAKLIEAAGMPAFDQDIEEWNHVHRLLHPASLPVILISPPGGSHRDAGAIARRAKDQGRTVVAVVASDDGEVAPHAGAVIPVVGVVREEFSPLVTHLFATELAPRIAVRRGRRAFQDPGRG